MEEMPFNIYAILVATLVTLVVGFIWYSPKVFGTIWMRETGITEEKAKQSNMLKIFSLVIVYSFLLSFATSGLVVHQMAALGLFNGDMKDPTFVKLMETHGSVFRTFKHGAFHGFFSGVCIALPITAINALFEQKSWRYILINAGYWIVSLMIMGGIICAWK